MFQTKFVENLKVKLLVQTFFGYHHAVYEIMLKKHGATRQATCGNIKWRRKGASR